MPKKFKFSRQERIKSEKEIKELLATKNKIFHYPLLVKWEIQKREKPPVRVAFLVSRRKYPRAVDRNLIKRRLRESYRIYKEPLLKILKQQNLAINLLFIYISPEILSFTNIKRSLSEIFVDINKEIQTLDQR